MTLRTSLIIAGDSDGAVKAANDAGKAIEGAEAEAQQLAKAYTVADAAIGDFAKAQALATGEIRDAKAALAQGEIGLEQYNRAILETKSSLSLVAGTHRTAMNDLAKADRAYVEALRNVDNFDDGLKKLPGTTNAAAFAARNLNYQIVDMAQGFALGMPPIMILMQQVPQAADAFAMLAAESGGAGNAIAALASKFGPIALAVGAVAGGVMLLTAEINKNSEVTVTWQDVVFGTFDGISNAISSTLLSAWGTVAPYVGAVWDRVVQIHKGAVNFVIASIVAIPRAIAATYDKIPAAYGDAFYSAANLAIEAMNWLVQKSAAPLNMIIDGFNAAFGTKIPNVVMGSIDKLANPYAGGMSALGRAGAESFVKSFSTDYYQRGFDTIKGWGEDHAVKREAEKAGKKTGSAMGKAAGAAAAEETAKTYADLLAEKLASYAGKIHAALRDIIKAGETPLEFGDAGKAFEEWRQKRERYFEEQDRINRARALDTAYDIADIIGGGVGQAIGELANALDRFAPDLLAHLGSQKILGGSLTSLMQGAMIGGSAAGVIGGSSIGGMAGGALGNKLGEKFGTQILGKTLGEFGGPLGSIAGGLIGGLIGGMMKSTPRASATVSIIAGEAMDTAIKGSSSKLRKVAGQMADGLISGLTDIADALGAELIGNASVSVGVRKGNYRVDTTGSGITKTSKGAVDFGDDQAAAIAFALQDAIKDGVLGGLSASLQKLITGDGDLQAQLQKALSFKSVFDDLAKRDDPAKWAQDEVTRWHDAMAKIFAEAGASADELAELERLTGLKRTDAAKEAADAIQQAAEAALQKENALNSLRAQILDLEGKHLEAVNLQRQIETSTLSEEEKALQQRIYTLQDEAEAAAKVQAIADERTALEGRLLELQGDTAALREREAAGYDESNRALLARIYALQDEKAAADAAAQAAKELADAQKAIADERYGLETRYLQAIGNTAALRARELDALDPSNRDVLQKIFDVEDAQAAIAEAQRQRDALIQGYQQEQSVLAATAERVRGFAQTIREFRDGLVMGAVGNAISRESALATFQNTSRLAALGNEASLSSFTGQAQAYLDAARKGTYTDYQDAIALVARGANDAIKGAEGLAGANDARGAQLRAQTDSLAAIDVASSDMAIALARLNDLQADQVVPALTDDVGGGIDDVNTSLRDMLREMKAMREDAKAERAAAQKALDEVLSVMRLTRRGNGWAVVTDEDRVLNVAGNVTVPGGVRVTNPVEAPVPVVETTP